MASRHSPRRDSESGPDAARRAGPPVLVAAGLSELSRSAGENVDLLMDGEPVGNGEIVVIEDTMGLRITDLRPPDAGDFLK